MINPIATGLINICKIISIAKAEDLECSVKKLVKALGPLDNNNTNLQFVAVTNEPN